MDINNEITMEMPAVESETKPPENKKKQRKTWVPIFISSLAVCITCFVLIGILSFDVIKQHGLASGMSKIVTPLINAEDPPDYNVLLVGTDKGGYRTDTMMVARVDAENGKVYVMQMPRDTYVENNGRRDKKLNSAYFSGIDQLKKEVKLSYLIDIDKYLAVELDGFVEMIDALGGVEMDVPINMNYDDPTPGQDLHIHIKKGLQVLDGADAEGFVRFRKNNDGTGYPMGDLQRMQAQREFITALIKKVISMDGISKIPELIKIASDNIKTDVNNDDAYKYIYKVLSIGMDNIEFIEAPGTTKTMGASYFVVDRENAARISNQYFGGKNKVSGKYVPKATADTTYYYDEDETEYQYNEETYYEPTPEATPEITANPSATPEADEDGEEDEHAAATATAKSTAKATPKASAKATHTPKASAKTTRAPAETPVSAAGSEITETDESKPLHESETEEENLAEELTEEGENE